MALAPKRLDYEIREDTCDVDGDESEDDVMSEFRGQVATELMAEAGMVFCKGGAVRGGIGSRSGEEGLLIGIRSH